MGCREVRLVTEDERILAINIFGIKITGIAHREHPVDEREGGPQFWPGADHDQFSVRVVILDGLSYSRRCDVLAQATLNGENGVFFVRHWLLVCNVILAKRGSS